MRLVDAVPKTQRPGGVPFSPSASKRTPKQGGKDGKDLKELKAALQGLQAAGPRAGLVPRPKAKKESDSREASGLAPAKELLLDLRFDSSGEPCLCASGAGLDFRATRGGLRGWEEELNVVWEEEDAFPTEFPAFGRELLSFGEAPASLSLRLGEELVDVWDEDDELGEARPLGSRVMTKSDVKEPVRQQLDGGASHLERLHREYASHFVQAVMDSTLIQAVTGHRCLVTPRRAPPTMGSASLKAPSAQGMAKMAPPELDTAHLEAAGFAEMEQRLEAALDLQLSAPSSPAAFARPLTSWVPPLPPAPSAVGNWETFELEAGLHLQLSLPPPPCSPVAPRALPQALAVSQPPAASAEPRAAEGSPTAKQAAPRGALRPSKSHRRIIGGVIRTPLAESEHGTVCHSTERAAAAVAPPAPRQPTVAVEEPAAGSRVGTAKSSKGARPSRENSAAHKHRGAAVVFRMDFDEPSMLLASPEGSAAARGSSLAGRYDALGAELFSMQDEADYAQAAYYQSMRHGSSAAFRQPASAMALDLGEDVERSSSFARALSHQTPKSSKRSPAEFARQKARPQAQASGFRPVSPTGSTVPKKQGLLPDLPVAPCTGSLAWTRRLNRPSSRCSLVGRGAGVDSAF